MKKREDEGIRIPLLAILTVFFRVGLLSFGGGLSGWVYREVVVQRDWVSEDVFLRGMALGQVLPGANVTNLTVYIGHHLRGGAGAIVALFGLLIGPFLSVLALVKVYELIADIKWMNAALSGIAAAAVGLLLLIAFRAARHASSGVVSLLVMIGTFIGVGLLQWPLVPVAICAGTISVAAAWPRDHDRA